MTNNVESYPLSGKELKSIVPVRTNGGISNISPDYWFQEHFYRWQRTEFCIFLYILNTEHTPPRNSYSSRALLTPKRSGCGSLLGDAGQQPTQDA